MIAGVRGRVKSVDAGSLVVSVGPIDVRVSVPPSTSAGLSSSEEVELRTYLHVREDQLALFGFSTQEELEIFELLLGVSGVGPKVAMAVVAGLGASEVRRAISAGDSHALARAPGVGTRVASRIVSDLQGKVLPPAPALATDGADVSSTVLTALVSMGYPMSDARRALERVGPGASVEDALRAALGNLAD